MTKNSRLKKLARMRMSETGETYCQALYALRKSNAPVVGDQVPSEAKDLDRIEPDSNSNRS